MRPANLRTNHTNSLLTDHMVFTPKYRLRALDGDVGRRCDEIIREECARLGAQVLDLAVNSDHVHLFVAYPPKLSVSDLARRVKGAASRRLRREFPSLRRACRGALWAPACYHGSVGQGFEVVANYIRQQDPGR